MTLSRPPSPPGAAPLTSRLGTTADTALGLAVGLAHAGASTARRARPVWSPVVAVARGVDRTVRRTPVAPAADALAGRGVRLRGQLVAELEALLDRLVPVLVAEVLRRVDLTRLVVERVDLDRVVAEVDLDAVVQRVDVALVLDRVDVAEVVARVDVDAVAARLDVESVLDRMDLTDLALKRLDWDALVAAVLAHVDLESIALDVIESVDLPDIIRESSGALTSDTVRSARLRGAAADQALGRVRDRFRSRHDGAGVLASDLPDGR